MSFSQTVIQTRTYFLPDSYSNSIIADANGNTYFTGDFCSSSITFGSTTLTNTLGFYDLFVVKLDNAGNVIWAKSEGSSGNENLLGIALDASGNTHLCGYYSSPSVTLGTTTLSSVNNNGYFNGDILVAKLNGTTSGTEELFIPASCIFQSPSNGIFDLTFSEAPEKITITNMTGDLIFYSELKTTEQRLDLSMQADGIYFLSVENKHGRSTQKIIIQH